MTDFDVIGLGEALIEFNQTEPGKPQYLQGFGGDTSNAVIAAARQGARTAYLTRIGQVDTFGEQLLDLWRTEGVDTRGVVVDPPANNGIYFVQHGDNGHVFSYARRDSAAARMQPLDLEHGMIERSRFLHVSGISLAISTSACDTVFAAMARARAANVQVCFDANLRLKLWPMERARATVRAAIALADIFLPGLDDVEAMTGLTDPDAIFDWSRQSGARGIIVLKMGKEGALVDDGHNRTLVKPHTVRAVDATGAGDCFAGSLLARLAAGDSILDAVDYANAAAALSTQGYGAVQPLPRPEQVRAMLAARAG